MINAGTNFKFHPGHLQSTLDISIKSNNIEFLQQQIEKKFIGINDRFSDYTDTMLHRAVLNNKIESVRLLIAFGASLTAKDYMGYMPLHLAAIEGNYTLTKELLEHNANAYSIDELKDVLKEIKSKQSYKVKKPEFLKIAELVEHYVVLAQQPPKPPQPLISQFKNSTVVQQPINVNKSVNNNIPNSNNSQSIINQKSQNSEDLKNKQQETLLELIKNTPNEFFCPITMELMTDPVVTTAGISYQREGIVDWVNKHGTEPSTQAKITVEQLYPNLALKASIEFYKKLQALAEPQKRALPSIPNK